MLRIDYCQHPEVIVMISYQFNNERFSHLNQSEMATGK